MYYTFLKNVVDHGCTDAIIPFPMSSNEAVEILNHYGITADIIYVDAAHEYEPVKNDIKNYWPMVKDGGYLFGDDYTGCWMGVVRAVEEFAQGMGRRPYVNDVVWSLQKI